MCEVRSGAEARGGAGLEAEYDRGKKPSEVEYQTEHGMSLEGSKQNETSA